MKLWRYLLIGAGLATASLQALACYTVYNAAGRVVYSSEQPPVDMSRPLHETLPSRFPGGNMVFDEAVSCQTVSTLPAPSPGLTRLLTDRRTAEAMHLPYTVLTGNIVLVESGKAQMKPGITVVPSGTSVPQTRPSAARDTVITEMRSPPMTIVQSGGQPSKAN
jgi:hypothetical protein